MKLDDRSLPLTQGQLDIWHAEETGRSGARQLGVFVRIAGPIDPGLFESAIRQVVFEVEPLTACFSEVDGQVFQKVIDYPDIELARYDLCGSQDSAQNAYWLASSIQRTLMALDGSLFKFALLQTCVDEFYLFVRCHHIVADGIDLALILHRIESVYNAIAARESIPCVSFGTLKHLIEFAPGYAGSTDCLDDHAYWAGNLPPESERRYRSKHEAGGRDPHEFSGPGVAAAEMSDDPWRLCQRGLSAFGASAAIPVPLVLTVQVNAGAADTGGGPRQQADWVWALPAWEPVQVSRLSGFWFKALAGIDAQGVAVAG